MRITVSFVAGIFLALAMFWFMQWLVQPPAIIQNVSSSQVNVNFIRELRDSKSQLKNREDSPPEPPQQPPVPAAPQATENTPPSPMGAAPLPGLPSALASFKGQAIGSLLGGYSAGDSDVMPLVQIEPVYPPQALARKIEGLVVLRMQINASGAVDDIEVIKAEPKGVFEREAIRAAYRYKFKPKLVDGKAVPQVATLPFEFKLEKK